MPMNDIFTPDAFSVVQLTAAINKIKFVPGYLGGSGLFQEEGVTTTTLAIEEVSGVLKLVAPTPRGGPGVTVDKAKRTLRSVAVPHFEINDAIMAEEVQGIRAFGTESQVETVMGKVAARQSVHTQSLAVTHEFQRIGAVKGVITYADASTLSLFTLFGVSQIAEIDFDLDAASPASGVLRKAAAAAIRSIAAELEGTPFSGVVALCGDAFFDDLIAHSEVRATYLQQQEASQLRQGYVTAGQTFGMVAYGGILWINYRGSVGATSYIDTDKCHLYPVGVPGLFITRFAPADYLETVNTIGLPRYSKQYDMPNDKGVHLDSQMNAIDLCTRPRVLLKGKRT